MAISSQLFRFKIELADITRSAYESLDFRVAQHPSESTDFLITRVVAYALNTQEGLKFSAEGLHNPDEPCLSVPNAMGGELLWIEIGNPSARKLHKAAKTAKTVKVYTYKNPKHLIDDMRANKVHRVDEIQVYALDQEFIEKLTAMLARDNKWSLTHDEGSIIVGCGDITVIGELSQMN